MVSVGFWGKARGKDKVYHLSDLVLTTSYRVNVSLWNRCIISLARGQGCQSFGGEDGGPGCRRRWRSLWPSILYW